MSEEKEGALSGEPKEPVVADYTDSMDREEEHQQRRESTAEKPEKPVKKDTKRQDPPRHVPLSEHLDERDKRQHWQKEAEAKDKALRELQAKIQAEQENDPAPDMFKNPAAYNAWIERQLDRRAQAIAGKEVTPLKSQLSDYALRVSEMAAEKALGPDRWSALNDWIEKQPAQFKNWAMQQPDPYAAAYQHYRQVTTFERLGQDDLDGYEKKLREKIKAELLAEQQGQQPSLNEPDDDDDPAPAPQKSMPASFAAKPSAGERASPQAGPKPLGQILKDKPNRQDKRQR